MADYTDEGKVESYLGYSIPEADDAHIAVMISAVQAWIDKYLGTTFQNPSEEDRYYDVKKGQSRELTIDPVSSISALVTLDVDGNTEDSLTEDEDYRLYPYNETLKNVIKIMPEGAIGAFPGGAYRVKVTGVFGATAVPDDIVYVATKLVGRLYEEGIKGGKLQRVQLGDYSAAFKLADEKADAMGIYSILDQHRVLDVGM